MVRIRTDRTATKSTTYLNIPSLQRLCDTIHSCSSPLTSVAVSGITDCLTFLRHPETVMHYTAFTVAVCLSVSRHSFGSDEPWLWKRYTLAGIPTCLPDKSLWSYHCATPPHALDSCAAAHIFQACRCGRPVRPWTWTGLPGRRPSAGRQDSRSTTPAVIVDVGIGLSMVGDRAFPVAAVRTWNSLPAKVTSSNSLQTFKTKQKSHLFWRRFHSF